VIRIGATDVTTNNLIEGSSTQTYSVAFESEIETVTKIITFTETE